jgi:hypothetical protein
MASSVFIGPFGISNNGSGIVFSSPGLFPDGTAALPGVAFASEPSSGLFRNGAGDVSLQALGVSRFEATSTQTLIRPPDGGAYLIVINAAGGVFANSCPLVLGSGGTADLGLSRLAAASLAIGTNTSGDFSGSLKLTTLNLQGKASAYNAVTTAGWGLAAVNAEARVLGTVNATVASVAAYLVGASDGSFLVGANINVSATSAASMTVTCTYTDETNVSRTLTFQFEQNGSAVYISAITNVTGVGAYSAAIQHIRVKAATTITIATAGTVTGITYNAEGTILQVA